MKTFIYLLLDAFVVFLTISLLWIVLKKCKTCFNSTIRVAKVLRRKAKAGRKKCIQQAVACATPIKEIQINRHELKHEAKQFTSFPEQRDWSQYDSPAYLRKGVFIH